MKQENLTCREGHCPRCGSTELKYGAFETQIDLIMRDAKCLNCGENFEEYFSLNFVGQNINDGYDCLEKDEIILPSFLKNNP